MAIGAGAVWALVLVAGVASVPALLVVALLPVNVIATASGIRAVSAGKVKGRKGLVPPRLVGVAGAVVVPLAALAGPAAGFGAFVVFAGVALASATAVAAASAARPVRTAVPLAFAMVAPTLAAGALLVARHQSPTDALVLVLALLAYDASAFVMGHSRSALGGWLGVTSGVVSVAVVAVFAAATLDPPFSGARPWVVFGLVALAAPFGVWLGDAVYGAGHRLPAFRRLDSLVAAAPVWVAVSVVVLHR